MKDQPERDRDDLRDEERDEERAADRARQQTPHDRMRRQPDADRDEQDQP